MVWKIKQAKIHHLFAQNPAFLRVFTRARAAFAGHLYSRQTESFDTGVIRKHFREAGAPPPVAVFVCWGRVSFTFRPEFVRSVAHRDEHATKPRNCSLFWRTKANFQGSSAIAAQLHATAAPNETTKRAKSGRKGCAKCGKRSGPQKKEARSLRSRALPYFNLPVLYI